MEESRQRGMDARTSMLVGVAAGSSATLVVVVLATVVVWVGQLRAQVQGVVDVMNASRYSMPMQVGEASERELAAATERLQKRAPALRGPAYGDWERPTVEASTTRRLAEDASGGALKGEQGCGDPDLLAPRASTAQTHSMSAAQWLQSAGQ